MVSAGYLELDWHKISIDEVYRRLSTSPTQGLSQEQVQRRIQEYGSNSLTPPPNRWWLKCLSYFFGGFGSILLVASVLVFVAWKPLGDPPAVANLALAIVLAIVFFIQAAFNFWQGRNHEQAEKHMLTCFTDWSTSRVMSSIKNLLPDECIVVRDGQQQNITGTEIVPGDMLRIKLGDKLPADVRFVQVSPDAKFDRSVLTGEFEAARTSFETFTAESRRRIDSGSCVRRVDRRQLSRNALHWYGRYALRVRRELRHSRVHW